MSQKSGKVLVIDDDQDILLTTKVVLKRSFGSIETERNPEKVLPGINTGKYDVILLDMNFRTGATSGKEGIELLKRIMKADPDALVIMITAYGDIDLAVQAMKDGAIDFIVKPWDNKKLLATVSNAVRLSESRKEIVNLREKQKVLTEEIDQHYSEIIGRSEAMNRVFETIRKVAATEANILLLGENGTGKELIARAIHRASQRASQIFVSVDLGAIPETLFESELFGHVKGAFTDAKESRTGRFRVGSGGTLFLDEIGNLPMSMQVKLLSAIENRRVTPVGSNESLPVDVRLICATNMPVAEMVAQKKFREDLLYRINTVELSVPPLRERTSDIPLLADYFKDLYARKYNKGKIRISPESYGNLSRYYWPGNVRELRHIIERTIILSESDILKPDDFIIERTGSHTRHSGIMNMEEIEKQTILTALERNRRNMTRTSEELGMARTTLYRKMKKYDI
jgi:two-component system response regulator HydG